MYSGSARSSDMRQLSLEGHDPYWRHDRYRMMVWMSSTTPIAGSIGNANTVTQLLYTVRPCFRRSEHSRGAAVERDTHQRRASPAVSGVSTCPILYYTLVCGFALATERSLPLPETQRIRRNDVNANT